MLKRLLCGERLARYARLCAAGCAVAFSSAIPAAWGKEPFSLTAETTSGTAETITASGSSVTDLGNDLVKTQSRFATLSGQAFSASLRYGGLNNAATYSQNSGGTSATLAFRTTGFTRTFTAANQDDLKDQIEDFLKKDGADQYFRFLRTVNERTTLGVSDGNPLATTALLSDLAYDEFGLQSRPFLSPGESERISGGLHLDLKGGSFQSDDGSGWYGSAVLATQIRFSDQVGLTLGGLFNYREVEGASVYNAGGIVGLPVLIIPSRGHRTFSWEVTPAFLAGASGSEDLAAGGTFLGGSVTSALAYRIDALTFTLANQYSYLEGYPIHVGDYDFDTDLNQQVLKNGVKVALDLGRGAFIDAGVTYTNFLNDAAVSNYWSPTAGLGLRFSENSGLRIAYQGDFGDGFRVHGGSIMAYFNN